MVVVMGISLRLSTLHLQRQMGKYPHPKKKNQLI